MDVQALVGRFMRLGIFELSRALVSVVAQPSLFKHFKDYRFDSFYLLILRGTMCEVVLRRWAHVWIVCCDFWAGLHY